MQLHWILISLSEPLPILPTQHSHRNCALQPATMVEIVGKVSGYKSSVLCQNYSFQWEFICRKNGLLRSRDFCLCTNSSGIFENGQTNAHSMYRKYRVGATFPSFLYVTEAKEGFILKEMWSLRGTLVIEHEPIFFSLSLCVSPIRNDSERHAFHSSELG